MLGERLLLAGGTQLVSALAVGCLVLALLLTLSIIGNVAAVGLSKPRNQRFEGLQLDDELKKRDAEPWCGVQIISLTNGDVMNWIRFEGDISEIFDIAFLPNVKNPMMLGLRTAEIRDLITFESELAHEAPTA